jgi:DNA polymerase-3 subunit delta'
MSQPAQLAATPLIGHSWVLDFVQRSLAAGRLHHALLVTGQDHIGKLTTALAIAQILLCETQTGCGACRRCGLVRRRSHADLRLLQLPPDRRSIPIRDVHEFLQGMALRPLEGERKVYVIDGADLLQEEGANALLKTLEEPPPAVTLILTASDPARLLPTIVSRCQRLALRPVSQETVRDGLAAAGIDPGAADEIAAASHGLPGWALLAAADPAVLTERKQRIEDVARLVEMPPLERLQYADALAERWSSAPDEVASVLGVWIDTWRDVVCGADRRSPSEAPHPAPAIARVSARLSGSQARSALARTLDTLEGLRANAHPRLALETLLLLWPKILPAPGEISS